MGLNKKVRIGDLLISHNVIDQAQLEQALDMQKKTGQRIGRTLIELGYVEEDKLLTLLSEQLEIPYIKLSNFKFESEITQRLPETLARRFRAVSLMEENGMLVVGMVDPMDLFVCDELSRILGTPIRPAVVKENELLATLDVVYRRTDEISQIAQELSGELGDDGLEALQMETDTAEDAPVVKLLQTLFEDAIQVHTSDIHIEPDENVLRIRQRIDGVLHEHVMNEKRIANAVVLRLKLMSGLDISEKRLPQDGRFNMTVKGSKVDVRISTLPTQHGESVVMRLLDQSGGVVSLDKVGMPDDILRRFRAQIKAPHGLVLVTGPTGSGKTTSLYGALRELNTSEKKIITVEDPVEYQLPRVSQVQINDKIGLNFAKVLKATLRQDPDVLLIGEIRDQETAEIALRASMTGHLVLSTLHTNDAISSTMRLIEVGVEGYTVAGALRAVIAQRLVRRICDSCTEPYDPDPQEKAWLVGVMGPAALSSGYKKGRGCNQCNNTGYKGRVGVFELLEMDQNLADILRKEDTVEFARTARNMPNFKTLAECALDYAKQGITSVEEVQRVSEHVAEVDQVAPVPGAGEL
jgi:MSHA biogenesis protein MshE